MLLTCILATGAITFSFLCVGNLVRGNKVPFLNVFLMAAFIVATLASFKFL